jgi:uncharacterized protein YciI
MLFAIYCIDKETAGKARNDNLAAHRAYLSASPLDIVLAGPLRTPDGRQTVGSLFVVDAPSAAEADSFNRNDPLNRAGVWASRALHGFVKRDV